MRHPAPADGDLRSQVADHCHELAMDRKRAEWRARAIAAGIINDESTRHHLPLLQESAP